MIKELINAIVSLENIKNIKIKSKDKNLTVALKLNKKYFVRIL